MRTFWGKVSNLGDVVAHSCVSLPSKTSTSPSDFPPRLHAYTYRHIRRWSFFATCLSRPLLTHAQFAGLLGSTVPMTFAVSGPPSGFFDFSGSSST